VLDDALRVDAGARAVFQRRRVLVGGVRQSVQHATGQPAQVPQVRQQVGQQVGRQVQRQQPAQVGVAVEQVHAVLVGHRVGGVCGRGRGRDHGRSGKASVCPSLRLPLAPCSLSRHPEPRPMSTTQFQVRKGQLATTRLVDLPDAPLADGQVRVRVAHFAYTSNNITYAAFGDAMHYWQFFPVPADADGTAWGCIPVWGFGDVVQSLHPGVAVGERLYGYWPMASHAVLQPAADGRTASATARRTARRCTRSTTSTSAAAATRSTPPTAKRCRRCCARCS
jgi:hypothetical protein